MWIVICLAIIAPTMYSVYIFMGYFEKEDLFAAFLKYKEDKILPNNVVAHSFFRRKNQVSFIPIVDALRDENVKMSSDNQRISTAL